MPRIIHFEINADQPERAVQFYHDVFDWNATKWEGSDQPYWLVKTGENTPGIDGGIMPRMPGAQNVINTIDVPSVDEYIEKIIAAGGSLVLAKTSIPGIGYFAYCNDTEGNTFGIMQPDMSAK